MRSTIAPRNHNLMYCLTGLIEDSQAEHTKEINKILRFAKLEEEKKYLKRIIRANRLLEEELEEEDELSFDAINGYKEIIQDVETFRR